MKKFKLGSSGFQISDDRVEYNKIRLKYQKLADDAKNQLITQYHLLFKDMEQLHQTAHQVAMNYLMPAVDCAVRDLISYSIMDIDDEQFMRDYLLHHFNWDSNFNEINEKYSKIELDSKEREIRRKTGSDNTPSIMGGGFGMEGAAQGMLIAGAANVAIGITKGFVDLLAEGAGKIGDTAKKHQLFNDSETINQLAESIYSMVFNVHIAFIDAIKKRFPDLKIGNISQNDFNKSKGILNNISKDRIKESDMENQLIESIKLNPYDKNVYFKWLDKFQDENKYIEYISDYFGLREEINGYKYKILRLYKEKLDFSSLDACEKNIKLLENYAIDLGIDDLNEIKYSILIDYKKELDFSTLESYKKNIVLLDSYADIIGLNDINDLKKDIIYTLTVSFDGSDSNLTNKRLIGEMNNKPNHRILIVVALLPLLILMFLGVGLQLWQADFDELGSDLLQSQQPSLIADRYRDNGDGTLTDMTTGLQWMRCSLGQTWQNQTCVGMAKEYSYDDVINAGRQTVFAGHRDWRVPTIDELKTLIYCSSGSPKTWNDTGNACKGDYQRPTIQQSAFLNTPASISYVWSSSPNAGYTYDAWSVAFFNGNFYETFKSGSHHVRLVRGGQ